MYSQIDRNYVLKQIQRHKEGHSDALWRIASHCDLFLDLSKEKPLTTEQKRETIEYVNMNF